MPQLGLATRRATLAIDELEQCIDGISAADMKRLDVLTARMLEKRSVMVAQLQNAWAWIFEDDV